MRQGEMSVPDFTSRIFSNDLQSPIPAYPHPRCARLITGLWIQNLNLPLHEFFIGLLKFGDEHFSLRIDRMGKLDALLDGVGRPAKDSITIAKVDPDQAMQMPSRLRVRFETLAEPASLETTYITPTLLDLAIILEIICRHSPYYHVQVSNCQFVTHMVFTILAWAYQGYLVFSISPWTTLSHDKRKSHFSWVYPVNWTERDPQNDAVRDYLYTSQLFGLYRGGLAATISRSHYSRWHAQPRILGLRPKKILLYPVSVILGLLTFPLILPAIFWSARTGGET
jgi:hypothetical protein